MNADRLPKILWLWVPLAGIVLQFILELSFSPEELAVMHTEDGPHETLQFLILLAGFVTALMALTRVDWKTQRWPGLWLALAALGCLYVGGEEISWGQHLLHWDTPEQWSAINDQNETNFHNTSSWLDQKPRLLLLIGVGIGGLVIPLVRRFRPGLLPARFAAIYPPAILTVTALVLLVVFLLDRADDLSTALKFFTRGSEVEELYMYWFVFLYVVVLRRRILSFKK